MSLKKNIIANYFGQSWATLLNFLLVPFYIKYLGPEAYGLIGVFTSLQVWIALLDMGIWPTVSREMAKFNSGQTSAESIRSIFYSTEVIYLFISILVGTILIALCPYIGSSWLNAEKMAPEIVTSSLRFLALSLIIRWSSNLYRGSMMGLQRQVWLNGFSASIATLRGLGALFLLATLHIEIVTFFKWQFLLAAVESIGLRIKVHQCLPPSQKKLQFSLESLKPIWRFARGTFFMNFFSATMTQADKLTLSRILPLQDFGFYTLAGTMASSLQLFAQPIRNAIYPNLVGKISHIEESGFISTYRIGTQFMALAVIPAGVIMVFFSKLAIFVWSGDLNLAEKTHQVASLITIGYMLNTLIQIPVSVALAHGWTKLGVLTNFFSCLIIIPTAILGAVYYGPIGAASAWVILNVGYLFINLHFLHKKYIKTEKWHWYMRSVVIPISVASCIAFFLQKLNAFNEGNRFILGGWLIFVWLILCSGVALSLPEIRKRAMNYFLSFSKIA